jgi:hypothetical protein
VDRVEEMAQMYFRNGPVDKWEPHVVRSCLGFLVRSNQFVEYRPNGKLRGFATWCWTTKEDREVIRNDVKTPLMNVGPDMFLLFVASETGIALMHKISRKIMKMLKPGSELWTFRKQKILILGRA